jgi:hypothetical protein
MFAIYKSQPFPQFLIMNFKADKKAKDALENYALGRPTPNMVFMNLVNGTKEAILTKIATPLSKIYKGDYGHSLLVCFDTITADELTKYDTMANRLVPNGFAYKKLLVEDDKTYLKLKIKDNQYEACPWIGTEDEYEFEGNVAVTFTMGLYLNFENKTSGCYVKINSLIKA